MLPSSPSLTAENAFNTRNLIRLHVVANSDSEDDQALKLEVRDAILARARTLLGSVKTKEEAWQVLLEKAGELQAAAIDRIRASGKPYGACVEMGTFAFPERTYGPITVPSGDYDAVRVVLGEGKGQNWWCVLFPPLCFIQVDKEGRLEGLTLDLSPGETLAKLRLDLVSPPRVSYPAAAPRTGSRSRGIIMASAPPVLPPVPRATQLYLSATFSACSPGTRVQRLLFPYNSSVEGLTRLFLPVSTG
ncbi:MAG: stage II sporulation protein R [Betaproteobacteria bacterium]